SSIFLASNSTSLYRKTRQPDCETYGCPSSSKPSSTPQYGHAKAAPGLGTSLFKCRCAGSARSLAETHSSRASAIKPEQKMQWMLQYGIVAPISQKPIDRDGARPALCNQFLNHMRRLDASKALIEPLIA